MIDMVAVGVCVVDMLVRVPHFPDPDGRVDMVDLTETIGGVACVAAVAFSRLGATAAYAGYVGDDSYGQRVRAGLQKDGVDVELLVTVGHLSTPTTLIISDVAANTRSIINYPSVAKAWPLPSAALRQRALSARYVHLDHTAFPAVADDLLPHCRAAGILVSVDAGADIPQIERYLPLMDIFVTTRRQILAMSGTADLESALAWTGAAGPEVVVATLGEEGSVGLAEDASLLYSPGFTVTVADTTGAGDVYHGALLYALSHGQGLADAQAFANAAAALSCRVIGGQPGCPLLPEVQALLQERKSRP